jgi:hypothetical protein
MCAQAKLTFSNSEDTPSLLYSMQGLSVIARKSAKKQA